MWPAFQNGRQATKADCLPHKVEEACIELPLLRWFAGYRDSGGRQPPRRMPSRPTTQRSRHQTWGGSWARERASENRPGLSDIGKNCTFRSRNCICGSACSLAEVPRFLTTTLGLYGRGAASSQRAAGGAPRALADKSRQLLVTEEA